MWLGERWQNPIPLSRHQMIIRDVCRARGIMSADLLGPKRSKWLVEARTEAIARMRAELNYSTPRIAHVMNRDHTTVLYHLLKASVET